MLNGDTSAGGAGNDDTDPDPPLANTTLHGLNHVVQQGPRARRLCWAVLLLLAMAGITWLLTDKIATFKKYPTQTTTTRELRPLLEFPAVTICNNNALVATKLQDPSHPVHPILDGRPPRHFTVEQAEGAGYTASELVWFCSFNEAACGLDSVKQFWSPEYGNCYTFHMHDSNFTLRTYTDEQRVTPSSPLLVARPGPDSGLTLVLNVGSDVAPLQDVLNASRTHGGAHSAGIRVVVHDQRMPPDLGTSILAPPGFNTLVGVQRHVFKRATPPHGKCKPAEPGYSQQACKDQTMDGIIAEQCQCSGMGPFTETTPSCTTSLELMDCRSEVARFITGNPAIVNALAASCAERCDEVEFRSTTSMGQFPSSNAVELTAQTAQALLGDPSIDRAWLHDHLAVVSVFYSTLAVSTFETTPSYPFTSLLSDMGGQLGLFAGISVLTVFELVEACMRTGSRYRDRTRGHGARVSVLSKGGGGEPG